MVQKRNVNNLIWVLCYTGSPPANWFPVREYVDITGADTYDVGDNPMTPMYQKVKDIVGDEIPISYHEWGTSPNPDKGMSEGTIWPW